MDTHPAKYAEFDHTDSRIDPSADVNGLMQLAQPDLHDQRPGGDPPVNRNFLTYYGMHQNPFPDAVNPAFFYQTDHHAETLRRMKLAIEHDVSLAMVTGSSGTGKTLITQILLQQLDTERFDPVLVLVSPGLSKTGMLREILSELNIPFPEGIGRTQEMLKLLSNHIIDLYNEGRKLVLFVDECHFLSSANLHLIRTISNIEIPERKLTTCLLFGESRFVQRLQHPSYESLRNRMFFRSELPPLSPEECAQYVKFRLMVAGRLHPLFTEDGYLALHTLTDGVGRSVNKLGMMCLLEGHGQQLTEINGHLVQQCATLL